MLRRILVPLDGSSRAERALPIAGRIARATGHQVLLLRVVNLPALPTPVLNPPKVLLSRINLRRDAAQRYLRNAARRFGLARLSVITEAVEGPIVETILEVADSTNADLIVMCSHGHTGAFHWPLGSVTQGVTRDGDIPTLVLRAHSRQSALESQGGPTRALIALDGSPYAERAIAPAVELIEALSAPRPAEAHLIAVASTLTVGNLTHYLARVADELRQSHLASSNLRVSWSLDSGDDPVHALAGAARGDDEHEASAFIAMAAHARTGWQRWVNGSVTESLLRATAVPLLITGPSMHTSATAQLEVSAASASV